MCVYCVSREQLCECIPGSGHSMGDEHDVPSVQGHGVSGAIGQPHPERDRIQHPRCCLYHYAAAQEKGNILNLSILE